MGLAVGPTMPMLGAVLSIVIGPAVELAALEPLILLATPLAIPIFKLPSAEQPVT